MLNFISKPKKTFVWTASSTVRSNFCSLVSVVAVLASSFGNRLLISLRSAAFVQCVFVFCQELRQTLILPAVILTIHFIFRVFGTTKCFLSESVLLLVSRFVCVSTDFFFSRMMHRHSEFICELEETILNHLSNQVCLANRSNFDHSGTFIFNRSIRYSKGYA